MHRLGECLFSYLLYDQSRIGDTENLYDVIVTLVYTFILSWSRVISVFRVASCGLCSVIMWVIDVVVEVPVLVHHAVNMYRKCGGEATKNSEPLP
jgi:hypothetical protein